MLFAWCKVTALTTRRIEQRSNRLPRRLDAPPQTLHEWVRNHGTDTGTRDGVTSEERDRIKALEREVKELRRANEILKLASAFFAQAELDRRLKS